MTEWVSVWGGGPPPGYADAGRSIQTYKDGVVTAGTLDYEDSVSDEEGNDYPIWTVTVDGVQKSFYDCEFYRFTSVRVLW